MTRVGTNHPPPDASSASTSASAVPTQVMVLPVPKEPPDFTDEELIAMMETADNIATKEVLIEQHILPKARFYVECLNRAEKDIKDIKSKEKKELLKEEGRIKKEQEQKERLEMKTQDFTVNVKGEDAVQSP